MGKLWTFITQVHSISGYASVMAIESTSKLDDEQWLAYWILYSFLTLMEMLLQPILEWIPIWYDVKLLFVAWLVLPQFQGAAFLYERYVREQMKKYRGPRVSDHRHHKSPNTLNNMKGKHKTFLEFITHKKGEQEAY
ncbi:HVA22-like protein e isoform X2 [Juglans regia]|uniref:HVA22-like protein n=1 Tax=Juglans regia TaxID=51240 RepID=A0A2I4EQF3_JUGRE|nr:HVA22-like protein e isoform X2 [Juglans regia]